MYTKALGKRLTARIAELGEGSGLADLSHEIQLARAVVVDAIKAYEASVKEAREAKATPAQQARVAVAASRLITEALSSVKDMVAAQAKLQLDETIDVRAARVLVVQMQQAVDGEVRELAEQLRAAGIEPKQLSDGIARRLDAVRLPIGYDGSGGEGASMTDLMPADVEAMSMDATVPWDKEEVA